MSERYEYDVQVSKTGYFTVMASDLAEAREIAYEMSDEELDAKANWRETEVDGIE